MLVADLSSIVRTCCGKCVIKYRIKWPDPIVSYVYTCFQGLYNYKQRQTQYTIKSTGFLYFLYEVIQELTKAKRVNCHAWCEYVIYMMMRICIPSLQKKNSKTIQVRHIWLDKHRKDTYDANILISSENNMHRKRRVYGANTSILSGKHAHKKKRVRCKQQEESKSNTYDCTCTEKDACMMQTFRFNRSIQLADMWNLCVDTVFRYFNTVRQYSFQKQRRVETLHSREKLRHPHLCERWLWRI